MLNWINLQQIPFIIYVDKVNIQQSKFDFACMPWQKVRRIPKKKKVKIVSQSISKISDISKTKEVLVIK